MRRSTERLLYQQQRGVVDANLEQDGIRIVGQQQESDDEGILLWFYYTGKKHSKDSQLFTGLFIPFSEIVWCERIESGVYTLRLVHNHTVKVKHVAIPGGEDLSDKVMASAYPHLLRQPKVLVIVNPHGGQGKAKHMYQHEVLPVLRAAHAKVTLKETKRQEHAVEIARDLDIENYDTIACCSGDGIPHEVINGFYTRPDRADAFDKLAITQLPCGLGNAMTLSTHATDNAVDATLRMLKLKRVKADVMAVTQNNLQGQPETKLSFLSQTYGVIADADIGTEHLRWMGAVRFDLGVGKGILSRTTYPCDVHVEYRHEDKSEVVNTFKSNRDKVGLDSAPLSDDSFTLSGPDLNEPIPSSWAPLNNTDKLNVFYTGKFPYISKDVMFFPAALPDDGTMDILITTTNMPILETNTMFNSVGDGSHLKSKHVQYSKITKYRMVPKVKGKHYFSVDGESFPLEPVQVEVLPKIITILLPSEGVNNQKFYALKD